jgi:hypothetical protein
MLHPREGNPAMGDTDPSKSAMALVVLAKGFGVARE